MFHGDGKVGFLLLQIRHPLIGECSFAWIVIEMAGRLGLAGKSSGRAENQWTNALAMPNLRRK
jgi:hypothetical protein